LRALLRRAGIAPARPRARTSPVAGTLGALMAAAIALPGVAPAQTEEALIQFGHYEEGGREHWSGPGGVLKPPRPLRVDTMRAAVGLRLSERVKLDVELMQDTWSGATPYITAPEGFIGVTGASAYVAADKAAAAARVDRRTLKPLNLAGTPLVVRDRLINLMTSASAETRHQGRVAFVHEWNDFALGANARVSEEPDYHSATLGFTARWDLDQKRTTLTAGIGHTTSRIDANLGTPNAFVDYDLYMNAIGGAHIVSLPAAGLTGGLPSDAAQQLRFRGKRDDSVINLGLTQVVHRNATLSFNYTHSRGRGFLESPHKLVLMGFANPATPPVFGYLFTTLFAMPEKRPDSHDRSAWNVHLAQYVPDLDAALHVDYTRSRDDWGVRSHTLETRWVQPLGGGWTVTPKLRYYTQTAASFYQPWFLFRQAYPRDVTKPGLLDFSRVPLEYWSSDQRLSAFGARSFGLVVTRQIQRDVRLEIGFEEYQRAGRYKLGGDGEPPYADFRSRMFNVALSFDLQGGPPRGAGAHEGNEGHHDHGHAHGHPDAPAGVMTAHMPTRPGELMVGYGYMLARSRGQVLGGSSPATDAAVVAGCGTAGCPVTPSRMTMHMHMLHLMYAPVNGVALMLMPQLVSMRMQNRALAGGFYTPVGAHAHTEMDLSGHTTGGFGDTLAGVMLGLLRTPRSSAHLTLGLSLPTGSVSKTMPSHGGELHDYGMQPGSGTWDFVPGVTWQASTGRWSWGGQLGATLRGKGPNDSGYTLGDVHHASAWVGYRLAGSFGVSLRAIRTVQGAVRGQMQGATRVVDAFGNVSYPRPLHSTSDVAANHGGRFTDVGLGMSMAVPGREQHGDRIGLEWILPVRQSVNGFQLERAGSLAVNWSMMF